VPPGTSFRDYSAGDRSACAEGFLCNAEYFHQDERQNFAALPDSPEGSSLVSESGGNTARYGGYPAGEACRQAALCRGMIAPVQQEKRPGEMLLLARPQRIVTRAR
jgi:hypothetical protein